MNETKTPPVLLDMQDPLPESNWLWRRALTFLAILLCFAIMTGLGYAVHRIVGGVIERIDTMSAQAVADITIRALAVVDKMFSGVLQFAALVVVLYLLAPSAEQAVKMISAVAMLRGGVKTSTRSYVDEQNGVSERTTTTGTPPILPLEPAQPDSGAPAPQTPLDAPEPPWDRPSRPER